jgi:hypothetical protein
MTFYQNLEKRCQPVADQSPLHEKPHCVLLLTPESSPALAMLVVTIAATATAVNAIFFIV